MRIVLAISVIATALQANTDPSVACKSACGLDHRASSRDCEVAEANGAVCRHVYREASGDVLFSLVEQPDLQQVTVDNAIAGTQATENNCFAMCYDNLVCRPRGSYCNSMGVCSALFWNKQKRVENGPYAFHVGGPDDVANQDAPVTCDSHVPEQPFDRLNMDQVDPCIATCHLSISTPDTCRWVQESNGSCSRLLWSSEARNEVVFSPRSPQGSQTVIQASELIELLRAPSNDCQALCDSIDSCRRAGRGSFCRPNGTCQGLFYRANTRPVKADLVPCHGEGCNELTPVMCSDPLSMTTTSTPQVSVSVVALHNAPSSAVVGDAPVSPSPSGEAYVATTSPAAVVSSLATSASVSNDKRADGGRMSQPTAAIIVIAVIAVAFF